MLMLRYLRSATRCLAAGLGFAVLAVASLPAVAQPASSNPAITPLANRAWAGCLLDSATVDSLILDMENSGLATDVTTPKPKEVAFVIVYSLTYDNNGQPLVSGSPPVATGEFTGPVLCANSGSLGVVNAPSLTTQNTAITGATILDAEEAFFLRYNQSGVKKRACHTVDSNTDCFTVSSK